jgi:hypothetical protein
MRSAMGTNRDTAEAAKTWTTDRLAAAVAKTGATLRRDVLWAHLPSHKYLYVAAMELYPAASVNAQLPPEPDAKGLIAATAWLDKYRAINGVTWAPGEPEVIRDRVIVDGAWFAKPGTVVYNLYRAPSPSRGDPRQATPWGQHVRRLYHGAAPHIIRWLAHRVQRPGEKLNHALVLGGAPGIGKDTLLQPVWQTIGASNKKSVSPIEIMGRFNPDLKFLMGGNCEWRESEGLSSESKGRTSPCHPSLRGGPSDALESTEPAARGQG